MLQRRHDTVGVLRSREEERVEVPGAPLANKEFVPDPAFVAGYVSESLNEMTQDF